MIRVAVLESYETSGAPPFFAPLVVSLIIGTILLPKIARKFEMKKNTRSNPELEGILEVKRDDEIL